jgi:hypothetical protein
MSQQEGSQGQDILQGLGLPHIKTMGKKGKSKTPASK